MERRGFLKTVVSAVPAWCVAPLVSIPKAEITAAPEKTSMLTGIKPLDLETGGIRPGELWVHASYHGELQLSFGLNLTSNLTKTGKRVLVIAHDNWPVRIWERLTSLHYNQAFNVPDQVQEELTTGIIEGSLANGYCAVYALNYPGARDAIVECKPDLVVIEGAHYLLESSPEYLGLLLRLLGKHHVAVLVLTQLTRASKIAVDQEAGYYSLKSITPTSLRYAADVITTTSFNNEHRNKGITVIGNLKNRANPVFDPFEIGVDFKASCRFIGPNASLLGDEA